MFTLATTEEPTWIPVGVGVDSANIPISLLPLDGSMEYICTFIQEERQQSSIQQLDNHWWMVVDRVRVQFVFRKDLTRIRPRSTGPYSFYGYYYSCYLGFHMKSLQSISGMEALREVAIKWIQ